MVRRTTRRVHEKEGEDKLSRDEPAIDIDKYRTLESELKALQDRVTRDKADTDRLQRIARIGIWEWNIKDNTVEWSDELYRIYGVEKGKFIPILDNFLNLVHPDDRSRVFRTIQSSFDSEDEYNVDFRIVRPDGKERFIHSTCETDHDSSGEPVRVFGIGQDITWRIEVERSAASEKERLYSLLDELPGFVYLQDTDYRIHYANRKFRELFGDPERVHCYKIFYGKNKPCDECPTLRALELGYPYKWEWTSPAGKTYQLYDYPFIEKDGPPMVLELGIDITERKQVEGALSQSEERFRATFEHAAVGMTQVTLDGYFVRVNQKFCDIMGYSKDEIIGRHVSLFTHPQDIEEEEKQIRDLISGDVKSILREKRYVKKDGSIVWVNLSVALVSEDGKPLYLIGSTQDISKRKAAEQALRDNERFFSSVFDGIQDGISVLDKDMNIIRANKTMERWHPDMLPLVGKKCFYAYHCRAEPCPYCPNIKAMKEKKMIVNIVPREEAGKTTGWREVYSFPLLDDNGDITGIIDYIRDVTDRKKAEEALRESEERFRMLADSSPMPMAIYDKEEKLTYLNKKFLKTLGYTLVDIPDLKEWWTLAYPDPVYRENVMNKWNESVEKAVNDNKEIPPEQYLVRSKDGSSLVIEFSGAVIGDKTLVILQDITERKHIEEALKLTQFSIDRSAEMALWVTPDGRFTYVNDAACNTFGYTKEEFMTLTTSDTNPIFKVESWEDHWKEVKERGAFMFDAMLRKKDGSMFPAEISVNYLVYEGNEYNCSFIRDITERKRAEEALKNSEAKFKAIFEHSGPAIFIADVKTGMIIECNSNAEKMIGLPRNEIIGLHQSMIHPRDEEERYRNLFASHYREKKIKDVEGEVQHKNGRRIPVWISAKPLLIDNRETLIGFFFDNTERKKAEENLKLMQVSIDRAADQVFWITPDASIVYVNDSACKVLKYTKEELEHMHVYDMDPDHPWEKWGSHWQDLKNNGSLIFESRHRDKEGRVYSVEVSANYVKYGDKELNFAFIRDITERKKAEEAVMKAKSESDLYIDLMGHDINNMNQITMGFLEMADLMIDTEGTLSPDNRYLLEKAIQSLRNSSNLIDNVKKLQREKRGLYKPERIDLGKILEEVVAGFRQIPGRNVLINYSCDCNCVVNANELLRDVFSNLIGNAIKHSKEALTIDVIVSCEKVNGIEYCKVVIEDTGPGISDKLKCTIFDRLTLSSTRATGKGFGLCLTKILIDDFNGKFLIEDRVEGDYTKGARFVVMMPAI